MKRFAMLSMLLFLPLVAAAQEETLFNGDVRHGGYGGLITKLTPINGQAAFMLGAEGVWIINNSIYVGGEAIGIVNRIDAKKLQADGAPFVLWLNEAGVRGGYILNSDDLIHFSGGALIGAGSMQLADRYPWKDPSKVRTDGDQKYYFLAEPEVAAELNVTTWMRLKASASYRIVVGASSDGMRSGDLSGPAGALTLMFGSF